MKRLILLTIGLVITACGTNAPPGASPANSRRPFVRPLPTLATEMPSTPNPPFGQLRPIGTIAPRISPPSEHDGVTWAEALAINSPTGFGANAAGVAIIVSAQPPAGPGLPSDASYLDAFDATGRSIWHVATNRLTGSFKVAVQSDGSSYLLGGPECESGFACQSLSRFDANGEWLWSTIEALDTSSIALTSAGDVLVGYLDSTNVWRLASVASDGSIQWTRPAQYVQYEFGVDEDDNVVSMEQDAFESHDSSGSVLWSTSISPAQTGTIVDGLLVNHDGSAVSVIVADEPFSWGSEMVDAHGTAVLAVDPSGKPLWGQGFGADAVLGWAYIAGDQLGNVLVAVSGGQASFLAALTSTGTTTWQLDEPGWEGPSGLDFIGVSHASSWSVAGLFGSTVDFGTGPLNASVGPTFLLDVQ